MALLKISDDQKTVQLGNLPALTILSKTQTANLQYAVTQPPDPRTLAILDSCGCSGASLLAPIPQGPPPGPSMAGSLFDIAWSYGWGIPSVSQSYIVADHLSPPEEYCCDTEIPTFEGGKICEQTVNLATFALKVDTCLLNQRDQCGPNGWEHALTEESAKSILSAMSMRAFINYIAINGLPSSGIYGLRNTPGVQTYNIKNYATLSPTAMVAILNGVWPLAADPFANMMFPDGMGTNSGGGNNDWVMVGGQKIISYLRGMILPGTGQNVLGTFTGSCPGTCADLGLTMSPNQLIVDPALDNPSEIYLIRRRAATFVANLFDENGNLSANGSMIHTCAPIGQQDCFSASKTLFMRVGGLLLNAQNSIIRVRFN